MARMGSPVDWRMACSVCSGRLTYSTTPGAELLLEDAGETPVHVDFRGQPSILQLVLRQSGEVLSQAGDLLLQGGFLSTERGDGGVEGRHHLRKSLAILGGNGAARQIGRGRVFHGITKIALNLGDLLTEEAYPRMIVGVADLRLGELGLEGGQTSPQPLSLRRGGRGRLLLDGSGHRVELGPEAGEAGLTHGPIGLHFGEGGLELI